MSTSVPIEEVSDQAARAAAINPSRSVLVQAPAGSGKTDLLTLRYLALLPTVAEPEQVLAITFTRKATAEMRARVLAAFAAARRGAKADESEHDRTMREYAAAALTHAAAHDWNLEGQPQRLNIQTIDSLALSIAYEMPLLSRLGGQLNPVDDASAQYTLAAQRTLAQLGSGHAELDSALAELLRLRDAGLEECEALLARLLAGREQWLLLLPQMAQSQPAWAEMRALLEAPFARECAAVMQQLRQRLAQHLPELLELARIAAANGIEHMSALSLIASPEELIEAAHWQCVCQMLLTKDDAWRSKIDKGLGFPASTHRAEAERLKQLIASLAEDEDLLKLLCRARTLPPATYSDEEWRSVQSIFILLRRAIAELKVVFAEQDVIDFAEASIAAHTALADPGVQMRREDRFRHVLVDEFQDTSRAQHALLRALLQEWQQDDGRTCFFVGDPMQSIYLFRQAEAALFDHIRQHGLELEGSHLEVTPLALATNFRSTPQIVDPLNDVFQHVLVKDEADGVQYAPAVSSKDPAGSGSDDDALNLDVQLAAPGQSVSALELQQAQADAVLRTIRTHLPKIEQAERDGTKYRVAVLVRTRTHLPEILKRLRQESIRFRGVQIEPLADRPEILDLLSLLRALLHPADRIAWLAVLRAPWCGLTLPALHALCGDQDKAGQSTTMSELLRQNSERLSAADRARALSVLNVLEQAAAAYADGLLSTTPSALSLWLERTSHALGAPAFLDAQARANSEVFFSALSRLPASSMGVLDQAFNRALEKLFAEPDPAASERCGVQVMTIHGAKGLEFEVVLVPALERTAHGQDNELFRSLVRQRADGEGDELLLAPLGRKHEETPALYRWVSGISSQRLRQEDKRLLYVACSRAIRELHLLAAVERTRNGALAKPRSGSLLSAGWPGLQPRVEAALADAAKRDAEAGVPDPQPAIPDPGPPVTGNLFELPAFMDADGAGVLDDLAAAVQRQQLLRLPQSWFTDTPRPSPPTNTTSRPREVHLHSAAGHHARIRGTVLHALLAHAATLNPLPFAEDPRWPQLTAALLRQHALGRQDAALLHDAILDGLRNALSDANGRWLLGQAASALNESSWSRLSSGRLERHRPDRVFAGGATPRAAGEECLWIIDYKTAAPAQPEEREAFLAQGREQFRPQLEMYSRVLRAAEPAAAQRPHRLAIYYPALPWLDWWPA